MIAWQQEPLAAYPEQYPRHVPRRDKDWPQTSRYIKHSGNSLVINPRGEIIFQLKENEEQLQNVILDWDFLEKFRKEFPVGIDADDFKI